MKRSFYQMLDVLADADRAQIDAAYEKATARLDANKALSGTAEAVRARNLMREGHAILADPERRARYDAKLTADRFGINLVFFPEGVPRVKFVLQSLALLCLTVLLAGIVYSQMSRKMDAVQVEHRQAVVRHQEDQNRPMAVDATGPKPVVVRSKEELPKR